LLKQVELEGKTGFSSPDTLDKQHATFICVMSCSTIPLKQNKPKLVCLQAWRKKKKSKKNYCTWYM